MARKIKHIDDVPVDVVEAVKRGFIWRGFIPRKYQRNDPTSDKFRLNNKQEEGPDNPEGKPKTESKSTSATENAKEETTDFIGSEPGSQEAAKDPEEPEPGEVHEKLIELAEKSHDILFTADTVWPFTFFPDTITLDREKLTVSERFFFRTARVITVPITSMISADANVGPFFGSVHMTSKYFIDNTHIIKFLWRHDAEEVHRLLQGFIIAQEKGLDVSGVEKDDLKVLLRDLGHGTKE